MGALDELINRLEDSSDDKMFLSVRNKQDLLAALKDLKQQIGNEEIKNQIAAQTFTLIKDGQDDNAMINILIYGGPGVGKTTIARIIGRIMVAIGSMTSNTKKKNTEIKKKPNNTNSDGLGQLLILIVIMYFLFIILFPIITSFIENKLIAIIIFFSLFIFLLWLIPTDESKPRTLDDVKIQEKSRTSDDIVIATRSDLVAEFVGQSAPKTTAFLESCRGKVILFDEAYSLYNKPRDPFGPEALTVLNEFMSNNAGEVLVIFAGYKEELEDTVFKAQPGLRRRFMWEFACVGYTSEELFMIYKIQMKKLKFSVEPDIEVIDLLENNLRRFANQAGDTEKLAYMCKTLYDTKVLGKVISDNHKITYDIIKEAINMLPITPTRKTNWAYLDL